MANITDAELAECIAQTFAQTLGREHNAQLTGGALEPLYRPATGTAPATLYFREDYPASALHEIAHWCIAGTQRRRQEDFGYDYIPGPRNAENQDAFFESELHTQSLERVFAQALGLEFQPSADNLEADINTFAQAIEAHTPTLHDWLASSAGARARIFILALERVRERMAQDPPPPLALGRRADDG